MPTNFSAVPSISISRSKFHNQPQHKLTMRLGEITPVYSDFCLPGETRKIDFSALIRMVTPVCPVMDNIFVDLYAFFTPCRLTWTHWREFMGENTTGAGIQTTEYTIPQVWNDDHYGPPILPGRLGDALGFPLVSNQSGEFSMSALPGRAYYLIYNRYFRDQNLIAPIAVDLGDHSTHSGDDGLTISGDNGYNAILLKAAKDSDYFTRATPWTQKGSPVTLPFGTGEAIVYGDRDSGSFIEDQTLTMKVAESGTDLAGIIASTSTGYTTPLRADLSNALPNINDLRFAFAYQKMLEKDALYGTRYWEVLKGHFGVISPDASLQEPQHLGWKRFYINVDQVAQTTGYSSTPASNTLGTPGAVSVTGIANSPLCTFSTTEHGILMVLAVIRHKQTYSQGLNRIWSAKKRTDIYFPVFANLGCQDIKNKELYAKGDYMDSVVFGYQEAWAEYRYKPDIVTGFLRPGVTGSVPFWTLANNFGSLPTLGKTFIEQDRNALGRLLATGVNGDFDFICDFVFDEVAVKPMPTYSIPGLIDHH